MRKWMILGLLILSLGKTYSMSIGSVECFFIENTSGEAIMYDVSFYDDVSHSENRTANGIEFGYVSPVRKDTIEPGGLAHLFECKRNEDISSFMKFRSIVKELNIYGSNGRLILTLDDIFEDSFTPGSRGVVAFTIVIDGQTIEQGRGKYGPAEPVNPNDYTMTYFDDIEFFDDSYMENFGISFYVNGSMFGFGINSAEVNFFPFKYMHYGLRIFEFNYLISSAYGNSWNFLVTPNIGVQYSFTDNLRISASALIKLGIELHNGNVSFAWMPGAAVNLIYKSVGIKYSALYSPRYGFVNEISVNYLTWFTGFRYRS